MAKVKFSASQLEAYSDSIIYANYLFMCKCLGLRESYQDYLNAFNEFLKSKDYQDSKKARKEC